MKRISLYIIALVTLGASALTSCKKEFNGDAPTFTARLEYNEKTQFTGGHLYWSENDQVAIYGSDGRSVYNVILTGSTDEAELLMHFLNAGLQKQDGQLAKHVRQQLRFLHHESPLS